MTARAQHRPHDGQGWLGKESRKHRKPKHKGKRPPPRNGRRPYVV